MDILEMLKKYGLELTDDQRGDFDKEFRKAYKSAQEVQKVKSDLETLKNELEETKLGLADNSKINSQYEELKVKYDKEIGEYKTQLDEINFNNVVSNSLSGVEFISDRVKKAILSELKEKNLEVEEGKFKGVNEFLQELYTNEPQNFKSVDTQIHTWGASGEQSQEQTENKPIVSDLLTSGRLF